MRVIHYAGAALAGLSLAACAGTGTTTVPRAEAAEAVSYTVLKEDASIPFANRSVRGFTVDKNDALILESSGGKHYRVVLWSFCERDLAFAQAIGLDTSGGGQFDRFAKVIVRGQRCPVTSIDEIEDPRKAKQQTAEPAAEPAPPPS